MARGSSNVTTGIKHRGRKLTKDCGPFPGDHTLWPERGRNGSNNSAGDTLKAAEMFVTTVRAWS